MKSTIKITKNGLSRTLCRNDLDGMGTSGFDIFWTHPKDKSGINYPDRISKSFYKSVGRALRAAEKQGWKIQ